MRRATGDPSLLVHGIVRVGSVILAVVVFVSSAALASDASSLLRDLTVEAQQFPANDSQEVTLPKEGAAVEGEIAGGQKRIYRIELTEGQFVRIEVRWHDTDLGVLLQMPDGRTDHIQDPLGMHNKTSIERVAGATGVYRITVFTRTKAPTGGYEIHVVQLHPATENELALQQARALYSDYIRIRSEGKFAEGIQLLLRALEIQQKAAGPDSLVVASTLSYLSSCYKLAGDYASSEKSELRALDIFERELGPDHPDVATELQFLGSLYQDMGDDLKAEQMYKRALVIFEKAGRTENLVVNFLLVQLGGLCADRGDFSCAESFYQRSNDIQEKLLGPDHYHLAYSISRLANVAYQEGNYSKAEALFHRALNISEKGLGPDRIELTKARNNLAMVYGTIGDYAKARALYERALVTHEQRKAMSDPEVQITLFGLARLYAAQGMTSEAVAYQTRASDLEEHHLELNLAVGSERQKLAFLATVSAHASQNISLHTRLAPNDPAARDLAVTTILQRKGRALDAMSGSLSALRQRSSPEDQKLLDQLNTLTTNLAKLVLSKPPNMASGEQEEQIKALESQRDELEAEISRRNEGFYRPLQPVSLAEVRAAVPENAALVEFAVYRPFDPRAPESQSAYGEPRYVAYVVRNQQDVGWVELGAAQAIDDAVDSLRHALRDPLGKNVYRLARSVDEKVMQPVRALTGAATQLLISPDGQLNLIPFAALRDEQERYLGERYAFVYLTSGRDLLRMQIVRKGGGRPIVIANPSFGERASKSLARTITEKGLKTTDSNRRTTATGRDMTDIYFAPLGGTAQEAHAIQSLFPEAEVLTGELATKGALKKVAGPALLHIATHGFFLRDAEEESASRGVKGTRTISATAKIGNPLLRSGLALAGANLESGTDNGILTALEASDLNLWGTKLVTLSACDTGLGEVKNGEGVYGLRRAFFLAGTESLVMSLWPVSDSVTRELMVQYYTGLKKGLGRGEALRQAQLAMLRRKGREHPFYWASFVHAGEWADLDGKR